MSMGLSRGRDLKISKLSRVGSIWVNSVSLAGRPEAGPEKCNQANIFASPGKSEIFAILGDCAEKSC